MSGVCGGPQDAAVTAIFLAVTDAKKKMFPLTWRTYFKKIFFFRRGQKGDLIRTRGGPQDFFGRDGCKKKKCSL